ncbi:Transmembrane protein [Ceratobasidium theobromae]|uniref:Transmembrane protein n=1 Tax=Ceratobasidium theobromae TaxID=1582974 RepID=A0A5N5QC60_9AGAM|nr:Transmembrane protein [Ceratobasidium theobromae]
MTTLVVTPTFTLSSVSFYQGNGVNTATELASTALPTRLVFDSSATGIPIETGNAATISVSPIFVGTMDPKLATESTPSPSATPPSTPSDKPNTPIAAIIMAVVAVGAIAALFLFLWFRKRARRRGHGRMESAESGPPAVDVFRKLGPMYDKTDPFSDANAIPNPFADPEKTHTRADSDSFLNMAPSRPFTHAASASTGSSASGKVRKREMDEARKRDMSALNDLVRALDQKDRQAKAEGRDRRSLPPVELFKAALVR